ncbi:MAG: RDD family protein [Beijerinckiaceae bacterium]|nr:RDD family protein [Beijerinckiaceae bacterium]
MSIPSQAPTHNVPLGELPARALEGVRTRRIMAIGFDLIFVSIIVALAFLFLSVLGVLTFGLAWLAIPFLYPVVALFYNGMTISGPKRATPGMRMMDLEMRLTDGYGVPFIYAAVHAVLFYLSWTMLTPLVLAVSLFARNKRCLHDILAGVVVTRRAG